MNLFDSQDFLAVTLHEPNSQAESPAAFVLRLHRWSLTGQERSVDKGATAAPT
jgi:hypothetical protein